MSTADADAAAAEATRWPLEAARAADAKHAADVVVLEVGAVLAITDHFVIASGATRRQVASIVEAVREAISAAGGPKPLRVEGVSERLWVLMDYGDFVVHVFEAETRAYYELERLWADVPRIGWS